MVELGKIIFRPLQDNDKDKLIVFCNECAELGYQNNSSLDAIKFSKMHLPYGQYFIAVDTEKDKIVNLAGVHHLPEVAENAWRCLFRGAQLPGYTLGNSLSKNIFKLGYQLSYILPMQMNFIKKNFPDPEFYMSSNSPSNANDPAGKSIRMDRLMRNTLLKNGVIKEYAAEFELFYTKQSIWKIDVKRYWEERNKVLPMDVF